MRNTNFKLTDTASPLVVEQEDATGFVGYNRQRYLPNFAVTRLNTRNHLHRESFRLLHKYCYAQAAVKKGPVDSWPENNSRVVQLGQCLQ